MRILIGTPIHESKDYCFERWLKNVARVQHQTPADLLLVDNSPNLEYLKKVQGYCQKNGVKNYEIRHINLPPTQERHEKVARSREIIRFEILKNNYDLWFCWESDQIIPNHSLAELTKMMTAGDLMMINHNNWIRQIPNAFNTDLGISLIKRKILEKYSFILNFGSDPEMPNNWKFSDPWLKKRIFRDGGTFAEVFGVLNPVYHLNNGELPEPAPTWDSN